MLDRLATSEGIMQVPDKDFDAVLTRLLDPWANERGLPVIASGMITSRNGWLETPYLPVPTGASQLAGALHQIRMANESSLYFVTGLTVDHNGVPDVMRGEETQIVGAVEAGLVNGTCVMPGTHSKWITVRDRCIFDFETAMTGEVFEALRRHTILGTLMKDGAFSDEGFRQGVAAGFDAGPKLLHSLFQVRALPLFGRIDEEKVTDYFSGMLIGAEVTGAMSNQTTKDPITILGRDDLAHRYAIALEMSGQTSVHVPEDIIAHGYLAIAVAARLL